MNEDLQVWIDLWYLFNSSTIKDGGAVGDLIRLFELDIDDLYLLNYLDGTYHALVESDRKVNSSVKKHSPRRR
jgi:hypothetical protein